MNHMTMNNTRMEEVVVPGDENDPTRSSSTTTKNNVSLIIIVATVLYTQTYVRPASPIYVNFVEIILYIVYNSDSF